MQRTFCQEMERRKLRHWECEKQRAGAKSHTDTVLKLSTLRIRGMAVLTAWLYADTHTLFLALFLSFSEAWLRLCQQRHLSGWVMGLSAVMVCRTPCLLACPIRSSPAFSFHFSTAVSDHFQNNTKIYKVRETHRESMVLIIMCMCMHVRAFCFVV